METGRHVAQTAAEMPGPRGRVVVVCGKGTMVVRISRGPALVRLGLVSVYMALDDDALSETLPSR